MAQFGSTEYLLTDNFIIIMSQSRYWGSETNKNEVQGTVLDQSGSVIHRFGGLWHEGIFCDTLPTPKCVWKPSESVTTCFLLSLSLRFFHVSM